MSFEIKNNFNLFLVCHIFMTQDHSCTYGLEKLVIHPSTAKIK